MATRWYAPLKYMHSVTVHVCTTQDDVIKWKYFPRYWSFLRGIHRSPVNSPHKNQWRGALVFSLICVWPNDWVHNRNAGDLRRHRAHYDVTNAIALAVKHKLVVKPNDDIDPGKHCFRHQANVDLSLVKSCGIHLRMMSQEMHKTPIIGICCKFPHLNLPPHLSGDNELNSFTFPITTMVLCAVGPVAVLSSTPVAWHPRTYISTLNVMADVSQGVSLRDRTVMYNSLLGSVLLDR